MVIASQRTELDQTIAPEVQTGTIWLLDGGTIGPQESNVGEALDFNSHAGRALDAVGDRGAAREAPLAVNDRAGELAVPETLVALPATMAIAPVGTDQVDSATVAYDFGDPVDQILNCTFSSDDEEVATVDAAGEVTGVADGTATITVSYTEHGFTVSDTIAVTVTT